MCFGCKLAWHRSKTCAQIRQQEAGKAVQFCPKCSGATVKSEGYDHMVCPADGGMVRRGLCWRLAAPPAARGLQHAGIPL